jgi:photosystem II stability/assembly factor-like uncharacterized protein
MTITSYASWDPATTRTTRSLRSICFTGSDTAFAVGDHGTIIRSTDGGEQWQLIPSMTSHHLASVAARKKSLIAVGAHGTVCRSRTGMLWIAGRGSEGLHLSDVAWCNDSMAIAVGYTSNADSGAIIMTIDSGRTWRRSINPYSEAPHVLTSIAMAPDGLHGVIGGHNVGVEGSGVGVVFVTNNGGWTWHEALFTDLQFDVLDVAMPNSATILVAGQVGPGGNGGMWRSDDCGTTWRFMEHQEMTQVSSIHMIDGRRGIAAGMTTEVVDGRTTTTASMFTTIDGGKGWARQVVGDSSFGIIALGAGGDDVAVAVGVEGRAFVGSMIPWHSDRRAPSQAVIEFGTVLRNHHRDATLTVFQNTLSRPLTIRKATILDASSPFSIVWRWPNDTSVTLQPGEEYAVTLRFAPRDFGTFESVLALFFDDGGNVVVYLSGTADSISIVDEPLAFTVPSVDFGSRPISTHSDTVLTAVVKNTSATQSRTLRSLYLDGVDAAAYSMSSMPPANSVLAPGDSVSIRIHTHGPFVGPMLARLVMETDAGVKSLPLVSVHSEDAWSPIIDVGSFTAGQTEPVVYTVEHPFNHHHAIGSLDIADGRVLVTATEPPMPAAVDKYTSVLVRMNCYPDRAGPWLIPIRTQWHIEQNTPSAAVRRILRATVQGTPTTVPSTGEEPISVRPVPASEHVLLQHPHFRQGASWTLSDAMGKIVLRGSADGEGALLLRTASIASGLYTFRLTVVGGEATTTVLIAH